jgi:hypothetical protein
MAMVAEKDDAVWPLSLLSSLITGLLKVVPRVVRIFLYSVKQINGNPEFSQVSSAVFYNEFMTSGSQCLRVFPFSPCRLREGRCMVRLLSNKITVCNGNLPRLTNLRREVLEAPPVR